MTDIKVRIELDDIKSGDISRVGSPNKENNASIQRIELSPEYFEQETQDYKGVNLKSWATGSLSLKDGVVGGKNTSLINQYGYDGYVFGAVPEDKKLTITLELWGDFFDTTVIYGDEVAGQYPTKAYIDGDTSRIIYSNDPTWVIKFDYSDRKHTITFLEWSRANYNACINHITEATKELVISKEKIGQIEMLLESTSTPSSIEYSATSGVGNIEIIDSDGELMNLINDKVINPKGKHFYVDFNNKTINGMFISDSSYGLYSKTLKLDTTGEILDFNNHKIVSFGGFGVKQDGIMYKKNLSCHDLLLHLMTVYYTNKINSLYDNCLTLISFKDIDRDLLGKSFLLEGNETTDNTTIQSDNYISFDSGRRYFVHYLAKSNVERATSEVDIPGLVEDRIVRHNVGLEWQSCDGFLDIVESTQTTVGLNLFNGKEKETIEYKDFFIVDLDRAGFVDKDIKWCKENLNPFLSAKKTMENEIIYGNDNVVGKVADYLSQVVIGYVSLGTQTIGEYIKQICEMTQLQMTEDDFGNPIFVNGRPLQIFYDDVISIPKKNQFSEPDINIVKNNEYKDVLVIEDNFTTKRIRMNVKNESVYDDIASYLLSDTEVFTSAVDSNFDYFNIHKSVNACEESTYDYISPAYIQATQQIANQTAVLCKNNTVTKTFSVKIFKKHYELYDYLALGNRDFAYAIISRDELNMYNTLTEFGAILPSSSFNQTDDYSLHFGGSVDVVSRKTISTDSSDIPEADTFDFPENKLIQTQTKYKQIKISEMIRQNIISDYKDGIMSGEITVSCSDFYNIYGDKVTDSSLGQLLKVGNFIRIDKDNLGNSQFIHSDGSPIIWRITGRKFRFLGCPFMDLNIQQVKTI